MRHLLTLVLIAALLLAGCTSGRVSPSSSSVGATRPSAPDLGSTAPGEGGSQTNPAVPISELIRKAPSGSLARVAFKAGASIDAPGMYFMQVPSGEIEGWRLQPDPGPEGHFSASADSHWVLAQSKEQTFLVDRRAPDAVYQWRSVSARLVATGAGTLLFATADQFWIADAALRSFTPIDLRPEPLAQAVIAPDGRVAFVLNGTKLYRIALPQGEPKVVETVGASASISLIPASRGSEVAMLAHMSTGPNRTVTRIQRYDWSGKLVLDQTAPGAANFSADSTWVSWGESLLNGVEQTRVIASAGNFTPTLRLVGEDTCPVGAPEGNPWLSDGSGMVVRTAQGYQILRTDGTLAKLPARFTNPLAVPVPAPDRPDWFAIDGTRVVDASGKLVVEAALGNGLQSRFMPWGESSDELRFSPDYIGGKDYGCAGALFPPAVQKAPFAPVAGLQVKVEAGDCVNLRDEANRSAKVLRCLPNGTRLMASVPPGSNNKGELNRVGNPVTTNMGGEVWWHVRTEQGERGWVLLSADYLTWAAPLPDADVR